MTNFSVQIINTNDQRWDSYVSKANARDIYFYSDYLKLWEKRDNVEAQMFFYGNETQFLLCVYLKRPISDGYFDLVSPSGYGGILQSGSDRDLILKFFQKFQDYCDQNKIVSSYFKFNPLIDNFALVGDNMRLYKESPVVVIDLLQELESIKGDIRKGHKSAIKASEKSGVTIIFDDEFEYHDEFEKLYAQTMQRNEASGFYLFPKEFFQDTYELLKGRLILVCAKFEEKIIAACLFFHSGDFVHYHLSGSDNEYRDKSANHLILFEVMKWAKEKGYKKMNLGGGVKGPDDPLFLFKSGFSTKREMFRACGLVHIPEVYEQLSLAKCKVLDKDAKEIETSGFFPFYRS